MEKGGERISSGEAVAVWSMDGIGQESRQGPGDTAYLGDQGGDVVEGGGQSCR